MTDRPDNPTSDAPGPNGREGGSADQRPAKQAAHKSQPPTPEPAGRTPDGDRRARSGADSRQRGWYWHWNGIVTEYAPLIGLKGVGLLNSYTVWTDRREHSPHRGYAFPSQQSEAAFYGEDRAELITINKILVALDLIEIRKEMVTRPDAQGRQWKVPHNFYRVKDRTDGLTLTTDDVRRVVELAAKDRAVYRYIRKIFSPRFAPIDRDSVWHAILKEIQDDPTWQRLAERTIKQEQRASNRSKAGHRARKGPAANDDQTREPAADTTDGRREPSALLTSGQYNDRLVGDGEQQAAEVTHPQTSVAKDSNGSPVDDGQSNRGSQPEVGSANSGLDGQEPSNEELANNGRPSSVAPSNTMYYQERSTTTTTTTSAGEAARNGGGPARVPMDESNGEDGQSDVEAPARSTPHDSAPRPEAHREGDPRAGRGPGNASGFGPVGDPSALVVSLFEAANDRPASSLERVLLSELERDAGLEAQVHGSTGAEWVAAAVREAVSSGSSFVAPKRIREILGRWVAEQAGPAQASAGAGAQARPKDHHPHQDMSKYELEVHRYLKQALGPDAHRQWFGQVRFRAEGAGQVVVSVPDAAVEEKLSTVYRPILERALADQTGQAPSIRFVVDVQGDGHGRSAESAAQEDPPDADPVTISSDDLPQARQLWRVVLDDLQGAVPLADVDRISNVLPLGVDADGQLLLGAVGRLSEQTLQRRLLEVQRSMERVLGRPCVVTVLSRHEWRIDAEV